MSLMLEERIIKEGGGLPRIIEFSQRRNLDTQEGKMEQDSNVVSAARALLSLITPASPTPPSSSSSPKEDAKPQPLSPSSKGTAASIEGTNVSPSERNVSSSSTAFRVTEGTSTAVDKVREAFPGVVSASSSSEASSDVSLDGDGTMTCQFIEDEARTFYEGTISLSTKGDQESLSPLHCFMRKYCVEAFTATEDDISMPRYGKSHSSRVVLGQVGIRCLHCKHRPAKLRQERAVCFPSSLKNIYHSIETWQRRHSLVCRDIPIWVKKSLTELIRNSRAGAGGRRQYWEEAAERLGMANTMNGIRFIRPPGESSVDEGSSEDVERDGGQDSNSSSKPSTPVVDGEDRELVTGYLFTLLEQMEACEFSEQDRVGGRSKVKDCPAGYPGMQCKHCGGKAGFGRYFPASLQALSSANSDRNIYNHVIKCRRCPSQVRDSLEKMQQEQANCKNRRGSRKLFFQRVWGRLHQSPSVSSSKPEAVPKEESSTPTLQPLQSQASNMEIV